MHSCRGRHHRACRGDQSVCSAGLLNPAACGTLLKYTALESIDYILLPQDEGEPAGGRSKKRRRQGDAEDAAAAAAEGEEAEAAAEVAEEADDDDEEDDDDEGSHSSDGEPEDGEEGGDDEMEVGLGGLAGMGCASSGCTPTCLSLPVCITPPPPGCLLPLHVLSTAQHS